MLHCRCLEALKYVSDTLLSFLASKLCENGIFFGHLLKCNGFSNLRALLIHVHLSKSPCQTNMYLFKVNIRNARKRYKKCSKLTIKMPEQCQ